MRVQATSPVRFSILGPLAASRDGEDLRLGGERQRALLAILLLNANQIVTTEHLLEAVFGGPRATTNAVHVAVSRLRRALGDGGDATLLTQRGGYMLALGPEQLDATIFERLVEEGGVLLDDGDPAGAAARLTEALRLWKGPLLADVSTLDETQGQFGRLEELRLLAETELVDAQLALGHAGEAVLQLERLIAREPLRERLRGQLMLALYRSGRPAEALAVYRDTCALLRDELGLTPGPELRELERMILRHDEELKAADAGPARAVSALCPFKGLAAFEASDAELFCGRERVVSELIARLAEWPLVGILGPSGIGKSSLLRAGVLPALQGGALPGSAGWRQVLLRPGEHPAEELQRALGGDPGNLIASLGRGGRAVIAVDQLEELFTVCVRESERGEFLAQLVEAASDAERRVLVLCALRADFYGRLSAYPEFAELLSRSHALVGPMDREELTAAIERPAARAGLEVEPGLVDALVTEVGDEPGGLPLLSTTLLELWQAREGSTLRLRQYRATGGVRGAVARIAEAAYSRLSEPEQAAARNLLLRLADVGEDAPERRRVSLAEIARIDGAERVLATLTDARLLTATAGAVEVSHEAVLREWPRYRGWLEEDRVNRRLRAHLRATAGEWDARGRDPAELYRGARLAAALDFLAQHPDRLDQLERKFVAASRVEAERQARHQRSQNRRLRALLAGTGMLLVLTVVAGVMAVIGQRHASDAARLAVVEGHAALGRQLAGEAINESRLDVAALLARQAVALDGSAQTEGTLLSVLLRSPEVIGTLSLPASSMPQVAVSPDGGTLAVSDSAAQDVQLFNAHTDAPFGSPENDFRGDLAPTYSEDGSLIVYPDGPSLVLRAAATMALRARLAIPPPFSQNLTADGAEGSVLIAPDQRTVYYAYWLVTSAGQAREGYLSRWSLPSGRPLPTVALGSGPLLALRLIDHGAVLVVVTAHQIASFDAGSMRLIRARPIRPLPLLPTVAAISPDGSRVVIGSQTGSVSFIDTATGLGRRGDYDQAAAVASAVYAPDGRTVVTVGDDGKVIVWNPSAATATATLTGPAGHVRNAAISATGSTLYTAGLGGVLLEWDLTGRRGFESGTRLGPSEPCCGSVTPPAPAMAMSPDRSSFAAPIGPSTVGVFSTTTLQRQASFAIGPAGDRITALAWSPTGRALAVGAHGGVVQLWSMNGAPHLERSLRGLVSAEQRSEAVQGLAFSPDGRLLAATAKTQTTSIGRAFPSRSGFAFPFATMAVWSVSAGRLLRPPVDLGVGNEMGGSSVVAFSPRANLLAATLLAGGVRIFNPTTGSLLRTLPDPGDEGISLAFAPDGVLAVGTLGGTVQMWNPVTGKRAAAPLLADSEPIPAVAFDPSGGRFATAGAGDGSIKLWSTAGLQQVGPRLTVDSGATSSIAFGPQDGSLLASDDRGNAFAWPMSLSAWEQRACSLVGRDLTRAGWTGLIGGSRSAACS